MEVLDQDKLDQVSGGNLWLAVVAFCFLNLEKISDSAKGLADGYSDGMDGVGGDNGTACTP